METHNEHDSQQLTDERILVVEEDLVAPGVPIVRTNTPRPLSVASFFPKNEQPAAHVTASDFPVAAPVAPPLPEEYEDGEKATPQAGASISSAVAEAPSSEQPAEFIWLFAYGLEMDAAYLNSPDRLNGQAYYYGLAVLKGYQLQGVALRTGQVVATIAKSMEPEREVWGVLYRIPQRLTQRDGDAPSALDNALAAYPFKIVKVAAHEIYRSRLVDCITRMAPTIAQQETVHLGAKQQTFDHIYAQQVLEAARRQKLPDIYLEELALYVNQAVGEQATSVQRHEEQNTEPLPVIVSDAVSEEPGTSAGDELRSAFPNPPDGWLLALALYLVALLMATLTLAVMQALGFWNQVFTTSFTPLGAPWYTLIYGLLGGCMSCMMTLGKRSASALPGFVVVMWFARPYLGAVLAALAYLVLSSGLFVLSIAPEQRYAFFSVVGAIAGLCEGYILFRQK